MKTVLITSFHVLISRNILAAPFLRHLTGRGGIRAVLAVPRRKVDFFAAAFGGERVVVEGLGRNPQACDRFLQDLSAAALSTRTLALKAAAGLGPSGAARAAAAVLGRRIRAVRWLDRTLTPRGRFAKLLSRYRPDAVFATDVFSAMDIRLMHEARDRGRPVLGMVRSWDNPTAKGLLRVVPDLLAVNSQTVAEELIRLHAVPRGRIRVVGVPHYDRYRTGPAVRRAAFLAGLGLDPERRLVLYAPTGDRYLTANSVDRDIIEILSQTLPPTHHLLVRLPPADSVNLTGLPDLANVTVERPGEHLALDPEVFKANELTPADDERLVASLVYADLVVCGPTTVSIDAAVFDRPIILVAFDGRGTRPYGESVRRYYDYDHMAPLLASGGAKVARSPRELEEWVGRYLRNPELDRGGRGRIVAAECGRLDGRSSQRLAAALAELVP